MNSREAVKPMLPMKSVAGALLFSVLLGPVGLLYSSVMGGAFMMFWFVVAMCGRLYVVATMFWLGSCIWSVAATNRYNKKIINQLS